MDDKFLKQNTGKLEFDKTRDLSHQDSLELTFDSTTYTFSRKGQKSSKVDDRVNWLDREIKAGKIQTREQAKPQLMEKFGIGDTQAKEAIKVYNNNNPDKIV